MSEVNEDSLKAKKEELEHELEQIQSELDDSLDEVKSKLDPIDHIRRHPLPSVGVALFIGFVLGRGEDENDGDADTSDKLTSTLSYEIKRLITRKGMSFVSNYIEKMLRG